MTNGFEECLSLMRPDLEYKVYSNFVGEMVYEIKAIINKDEVLHSGNVHCLPAVFATKEVAQEFLSLLNKAVSKKERIVIVNHNRWVNTPRAELVKDCEGTFTVRLLENAIISTGTVIDKGTEKTLNKALAQFFEEV